MALKERSQGGFVIKSEADAVKALALALELQEEIKPVVEEVSELKESVARWMDNNDQKQLQLPELSKHGTLVQRHNPSKWDGVLLLKLVKAAKPKDWKKVWQQLTERVPDSEKIQEAIKAGKINGDAISEAYIQGTPQKAFVQVFSDD